jgi:hypothetical protein
MISNAFYNKKNLIAQFLGGKVSHYPIKDASVTYSWYEYIVKDGETLYSIAERIFGEGLEHLWTLIADNNPPRMPDDWQAGDVLKLPRIIIRDSDTQRNIYSTNG